MQHHLLLYDYVEDIVARRSPHREAHLAALHREFDAGHVLIGGAFGDPPAGAAIVFAEVDIDHVRSFAEADPYVEAGLVLAWRVEPYTVVVHP